MKPSLSTIVACIALLLAAAAWAGVWYEYVTIRELRIAHAEALSQVQSKEVRDMAQSRLRSLITDTAEARTRLTTLVKSDIIESAKVIESIGPAAQVDLKVANATKVGRASGSASAAHPLYTIEYSIEASGSFSRVMKAVQLLYALPLPMRVARVEVSVAPADPTGKTATQWHLSARAHLFTDSETP